MSVEIIYDRDEVRVIVTDGMVAKVDDHLLCPTCGRAAGYVVAWFTENMIRPVRSYQLLACMHEFDTREYYLHVAQTSPEFITYEIRPVPEDRRYDPIAVSVERSIWTTAGNAESSREIFHMYGDE